MNRNRRLGIEGWAMWTFVVGPLALLGMYGLLINFAAACAFFSVVIVVGWVVNRIGYQQDNPEYMTLEEERQEQELKAQHWRIFKLWMWGYAIGIPLFVAFVWFCVIDHGR